MSIGEKMKKLIILILGLSISLMAKDIVVYENEYLVLDLDKSVKKLIVGNRDIMNVSLLDMSSHKKRQLKLFGKKSGNTSILLMYRDGTLENYHVYVNQNLGYIQKMINVIEPNIHLSKVGNGSTVISGLFSDPHQKNRVYELMEHAGLDLKKLMDITDTAKINKMIRTKLYLVKIDNEKAKNLGGVTGLGFLDEQTAISLNSGASTSATFSGFLLDNTGKLTSTKGNSFASTLKFLETKDVAKILDDTVLISTEDKNASFHVGGNMYIPAGMSQNSGGTPTVQLAEHEYGLRLTLSTGFLEKDGFMHINVNIEDSAIDISSANNVQLGDGISVPSFVSKHISTDIVAQSGQIIALGGRLHTEDYEYDKKIPLLGDIPFLGELFKTKETGVTQNDILFFLIPEIVDANNEINDINYYNDMKTSNKKIHESILDTNKSKNKVDDIKSVEDEKVTQKLENTDSVVVEKVDEEIKVEDDIVFVDKNSKDRVYRAVSTEKIFLRAKPVDGKRVEVWIKGHKFVSDNEIEVDGTTWLKIKEDCQNDCIDVDTELWISKKHTDKV